MAVPNYYNTVVEVANKYPQEFREAHTGGPRTELWIKLLGYELNKLDSRFGLNGKRGTDTLSQDAINYKGEGVGFDPVTGDKITVIDVIAGAGGNNPTPSWQVFNDPNKDVGPGKWIQPQPVQGYHTTGPVIDPPKEPSQTTLINALQAVESQIKHHVEVTEKLIQVVEQQTALFAKGFSVTAKGGWPVGDLSGEIKPKG